MDPGDDQHLYLLQQSGKIWKYDLRQQKVYPEPFLDLSQEMEALYQARPMGPGFPDERGLLSLVFHPEYNQTGSLFQGVFLVLQSELARPEMYDEVSRRQIPDPDHMSCLVAYVNRGSAPATKATARYVLCMPEPQANHNGGILLFAPDGNLWYGTGDGGGANDEHGLRISPSNFQLNKTQGQPLGWAQDPTSWHGKLLRLQIVQPMKQKVPYIIPQDNPFVGQPNKGRPEIYAWGLRNPWRGSLDSEGKLLIGDVGQNQVESVNKVTGPANFGWRAMEGDMVFDKVVLNWIQARGQTIQPPLISYPRDMGVAIVGVQQYHGELLPDIKGKLVIADYSGKLLLAESDGGNLRVWRDWGQGTQAQAQDQDQAQTGISSNLRFHSLDHDNRGELYLTSFNPQSKQGAIHQLTDSPGPSKMRPQLSADEIETIVQQALVKAGKVKSALRRVEGQPANVKMQVALIQVGQPQARIYHQTPDAWVGSLDIAKRKAYTALAFSSDENALSTRSIRALSQPGKLQGKVDRKGQTEMVVQDIALWQIGNSNPEGGIIEFPGGVPLYKAGRLVGALGVSGDAVDQDETVARAGAQGFEADPDIRSDVAGVPFYGPMVAELSAKELRFLASRSDKDRSVEIKPRILVGRAQWRNFKKRPDDRPLQLFISGDRELTDLKEFMPWAQQFDSINFFHTRLGSLSGIEQFVNLQSLNVSRTEIGDQDLAYLTRLTGLKRLELNGNTLADISPLVGLNPVFLGLACLQIGSLEPLRGMTDLRILDLYQNPELEDISALADLDGLEDLDVRQSPVDVDSIQEALPNTRITF